jgi:hypothetical protein
MRVRDAVEADAAALADLCGRPTDAIVEMIHQRTVVVGEPDSNSEGRNERDEESEDNEAHIDHNTEATTRTSTGASDERLQTGVAGFVAFDATDDQVHVTSFAGAPSTVERLLEVPKRFARRESMDLEAVVVDNEPKRVRPVEAAGFTPVGAGPRFDGEPTTRFRLGADRLSEE